MREESGKSGKEEGGGGDGEDRGRGGDGDPEMEEIEENGRIMVMNFDYLESPKTREHGRQHD